MNANSVSLIARAILAHGLLAASGVCDARAEDDDARSPWAAADPVQEIDRINEARRQDLIARQLDLNYRMIGFAGFGPRYPNPFEPWPRVPGDIWGFPGPRPIEQPLGHESAQTGPNRWTYRPLYAADLAPPVEAREIVAPPRFTPAAPRGKMQRPGPSDLSEPAPRRNGPREF